MATIQSDSADGRFANSYLATWRGILYDSAIPRLPITLALACLLVAATACSPSSKPLGVPLTAQDNIQLPRDVGLKLIEHRASH